jgi:rhamnosyltransferase
MNKNIYILMATYNGEKYIEEQIDSILNQTYKDWTLIIHDDNSKDNAVKNDKRI